MTYILRGLLQLGIVLGIVLVSKFRWINEDQISNFVYAVRTNYKQIIDTYIDIRIKESPEDIYFSQKSNCMYKKGLQRKALDQDFLKQDKTKQCISQICWLNFQQFSITKRLNRYEQLRNPSISFTTLYTVHVVRIGMEHALFFQSIIMWESKIDGHSSPYLITHYKYTYEMIIYCQLTEHI